MDDAKVYVAIVRKPSIQFSNASTWHNFISLKLAASFPCKSIEVRIVGHVAPVEVVPSKETKEATPATVYDDDLNLFGNETEEAKRQLRRRDS